MIGTLLFDSAGLFDGESIIAEMNVLVEGPLIAAVAPASEIEVPKNAEVIECRGMTMLPGFIDAHVHIGFFDPRVVLMGGITSVRDLGWPRERIVQIHSNTQRSLWAGPKILFAGAMITAPSGYPTRAAWAPPGTGVEVHEKDDVRSVVRELVESGVSVIKVAQEPREGPVLDVEVLQEVVRVAHDAGLRVTSHLGSLDQLEVAIESGIDELAHGLWSNERIPDDTISRMVTAGMAIVPTLHIDPSPQRIDNLGRFFEGGGIVIYGTDMGNSGPPPGIDVDELRLMTQAGMPASTAIACATSIAGPYLGMHDRGLIAPGYIADLLLVDGNPLADSSVLAKPSMLLREGQRVDSVK